MIRTLLLLTAAAASLCAQAATSIAELKQLTEKEPQNGAAWFRLGDALLAAGQFEDAVPAFQQARQKGFQPPVTSVRILRAFVL
ncbi:MAG: tetratricopeptide repeat protein, partial [Bryobacteraceae bacterium]